MDTIAWIIGTTEQNQFAFLGRFGERLLFRDTSECPFTKDKPYIYDLNESRSKFIQPGEMTMDEYNTYYGRLA
jgi:hypothetical protein